MIANFFRLGPIALAASLFLFFPKLCFGQYLQNIDKTIESTVKSTVKRLLKDPESAIFSEQTFYRDSEKNLWACGLVNAKNSYGGYAGNTKFLVVTLNKDVLFSHIESDNNEVLRLMCNPERIEKNILARREKQVEEAKHVCPAGSTPNSPGPCGQMLARCKEYSALLGEVQGYMLMDHCRRLGEESAKSYWNITELMQTKKN